MRRVHRTVASLTGAATASIIAASTLAPDECTRRDAADKFLQDVSLDWAEPLPTQTDSSVATRAAEALERRGVAVLHGLYLADEGWTRGVDIPAAAAALGALAAACLPTVHQADAWNRTSFGEQLGRRAAAAAIAYQAPSLAGCAQAVAQLRPHATRPYPPTPLPLPTNWRALSLQQAPIALDALEEMAQRAADALEDLDVREGIAIDTLIGHGGGAEADAQLFSVGRDATTLRGWAAVLLAAR